ncbi:PLP-dependent aminotransferase family protein [Jiangella aurantiaca]|uniref:PLP-dependent aminotransferase family protein n=1 Tax=Jiangella aurantiaca TaxID=2530373 RepID=A0A4V2YR86_9ACTN|nr:PLP-dependent aminotransferase family protein [Jiangella aurantiaca]TDD64947.1 PLP-dependent aminotransferase family protein [Jiangella aurantiaca]
MARSIVADFTRSIPPAPDELGAALSSTLREMATGADLGMLVRESRSGGGPADRAAAAAWLARRMPAPDPSRVVLTNGTQSSLLLVLRHLTRPGDVVLAEGLTYGVMRQLAERARLGLRPVALDADGMLPDALDAACRDARPALIYCNPTYQNPTTSIMSAGRRAEIVAVARRHGVPIFEDDVLGALHTDAPPPLVTLAPELTWYSMGLTKALAQGLRVGYLVGPGAPSVQRLLGPVARLSYWVANPLSAEVLRRWIADGRAAAIASAIHRESSARQILAREYLAGYEFRAQEASMHLWLRVPPGHSPRGFTATAAGLGVLVRPAEMFTVDDYPAPPRVRLSLSTPLDRGDVRRGLEVLAAMRDEPPSPA